MKPPDHLSRPSKAFWRRIEADYELAEADFRLLRAALEAWDRAEQARIAIDEHGLTFVDRFGQPRARPECQVERDNRAAFVRTLRELALDGGAAPQPERIRGR